jgi:nucleotide-binding universal stress UspA family protein
MTRQAHDRLLRLSTSFDTRRNRYRLAVNRGDPAYQATVQQQASQADLMVVGKGRRHALLDGWWPSLAWRLVGLAGCDVLVVPDHHRAPDAPRPLAAFAENGSLG